MKIVSVIHGKLKKERRYFIVNLKLPIFEQLLRCCGGRRVRGGTR